MRATTPAILLACSLHAGCDPTPTPATDTTAHAPTGAPAPSSAASTAAPSAMATAAPSVTASAPRDPGAPFVRHPPHSLNSDADAVDECTQVGGNYFSCRGAYGNEKDPVLKRYLWRIQEAGAAGEHDYSHKGPPETDLPHAEVPYMCDPAKPCNATNESGELNSAVSCLARAYAEQMANRPGAARAAHAHACKCDPTDGAVPGYNATPFLCDKAGKPAFIAPGMKSDEAADILACAACEPKSGPKACAREVARLETSDAELAAHIRTRQIPRCQTPNDGPRSWD